MTSAGFELERREAEFFRFGEFDGLVSARFSFPKRAMCGWLRAVKGFD
jgi:hypothetical protein